MDQSYFKVHVETWVHCKCGWYDQNCVILISFVLEFLVSLVTRTALYHEYVQYFVIWDLYIEMFQD